MEWKSLLKRLLLSKSNVTRGQAGFTLIEILMVIVLIAILAGVAITQFTDFSPDAKNNAVKANLQVMRRAIAVQSAQMRLRCAYSGTGGPPLATLNANDITAAVPCTTALVTNPGDRPFVQSASLPTNNWGNVGTSTVVACVNNVCNGCTAKTTCKCDGSAARAATDDGWCYDVTTGSIWANSSKNGNAAAYESSF